MRYPVDLVPEENGTISARLPDIPGCHTFGDSESEALAHAVDATESMLAAMVADAEDIPVPSDGAGRPTIVLPAMSVAKIGLYEAMREAKIGKAELARRLGWRLPQIDRVLDLNHASKFEQVEIALRALGKQIAVHILDAA